MGTVTSADRQRGSAVLSQAEGIFQRRARGMVSAHPVDSSTRRCRCGAYVEAARRRAIWIEGEDRPHQKLPEIIGAASNVSSDEIGIRLLHLGSVSCVAGQHQIAKPGGESFYLSLDGFCHVARRTVRHVAIGPAGMPA